MLISLRCRSCALRVCPHEPGWNFRLCKHHMALHKTRHDNVITDRMKVLWAYSIRRKTYMEKQASNAINASSRYAVAITRTRLGGC